jgi:hypothetical protein
LTVSTDHATIVTELRTSLVNLFEGEWGLKLRNGGAIGKIKGFGGSIWLDGRQSLTVGSFLKGEATVPEVAVYVDFDTAEGYSQFSVTGECNVCVSYRIFGKINGLYASPEQLPATLLQWGETTLGDLRIYFRDSQYLHDHTSDYSVTETGAVVHKP